MSDQSQSMQHREMSIGFSIRLMGVALAYIAAAQVGLQFAVIGNTVTLAWLPSGIALVAALIFGCRIAPGIALGAFLANAWSGLPWLLAASIAAGNTFEACAGAWLLQHLARFQNTLERRRDIFALFLLAAVGSTALSALVGATTLSLGDMLAADGYASAWVTWWLGDMMGVLVVAPLLLVGCTHARPILSARNTAEAAGLLLLLLVTAYWIFGAPELAGHGYYPASLAVFPFIIWAALRFQFWGATLVTAVVATLAILGTAQGTGPLSVASPVDSLVGWCIFVNLLSITGLLLAAAGTEQIRAQAQIKRAHDELEQRVTERTEKLTQTNAGLLREMAERERLEVELIQISEAQRNRIGRELHDGLGQHLTSIALFGATLRQKLDASAHPEADAAQTIVDRVNQAIDMTREVARGLYPAALESRGLAAALEQLADNTRSLEGVSCVFSAAPDARVSDPLVAINLYRIAQEAINNALKHGQARCLWIDLACADGKHILAINDDGIGCDLEHIEPGQGLGIHSLRFRAGLLGGSLAIARNAHGGTTVAVTYPAPSECPA